MAELAVADILWPSDNDWGVPTLDLHQQAVHPIAPVECWGRVARKSAMRGTWHFYYRFTALWRNPIAVVRSGCACAVEPNFSVYPQTPRALDQLEGLEAARRKGQKGKGPRIQSDRRSKKRAEHHINRIGRDYDEDDG